MESYITLLYSIAFIDARGNLLVNSITYSQEPQEGSRIFPRHSRVYLEYAWIISKELITVSGGVKYIPPFF